MYVWLQEGNYSFITQSMFMYMYIYATTLFFFFTYSTYIFSYPRLTEVRQLDYFF